MNKQPILRLLSLLLVTLEFTTYLMTKNVTLLCLLSLLMTGLSAQEPSKKALRKEKRQIRKSLSRDYFILGLGGAYANLQDLQMSNSRYSGYGAYAEWRKWLIQPHGKHDIIWLSSGWAATRPPHNGTTAQLFTPEMRYTYTRNIASWGHHNRIRFGGYASAFLAYKANNALGNSSDYVDFMPSIGPAADLEMSFTMPIVKVPSYFTYSLSTSLFAYLLRLPEYAISDGTTATYWMPIGRQGRIMSEASLIVPLNKGNLNQFKLAYAWDFYGYQALDIYQNRTATHSLTFSVMIALHTATPNH